jgi:hypothetical protein
MKNGCWVAQIEKGVNQPKDRDVEPICFVMFSEQYKKQKQYNIFIFSRS